MNLGDDVLKYCVVQGESALVHPWATYPLLWSLRGPPEVVHKEVYIPYTYKHKGEL